MRKPPKPVRAASRRPPVKPALKSDGEVAPSQIKTLPAAISTARAAGARRQEESAQRVVRSADRFAERARLRRRLSLRRYLLIGAIGLVIFAAVWLILISSFFRLDPDAITVTGVEEYVSEGDVREVFEQYADTPLIRLDLDDVRADIAEVRGVSSAIIRRDWPSGLRVSLSERVPVAAVESDAEYILLDADGARVGTSATEPEGVALAQVPLKKGRESSLAAVLTVLDEIPAKLREEIADIGADSRDTVFFTLESGERVEWGSSDDSALKASVLEILRQQEAGIYDVSAPTLPVTRE